MGVGGLGVMVAGYYTGAVFGCKPWNAPISFLVREWPGRGMVNAGGVKWEEDCGCTGRGWQREIKTMGRRRHA